MIALLVNPNDFAYRAHRAATRRKRRVRRDWQLHILKAEAEGEIDTAFASFARLHAGALVVAHRRRSSMSRRERLVALAARDARSGDV